MRIFYNFVPIPSVGSLLFVLIRDEPAVFTCTHCCMTGCGVSETEGRGREEVCQVVTRDGLYPT